MKYSFSSRIHILTICILAFAVLMIGRLFWVQIIKQKTYKEEASRQYYTLSSRVFERGSIFFERKDKELVSAGTQVSGYKLALNPTLIKDKQKTYQELNKIIPLDEAEFMEKAGKTDDIYEEIQINIPLKEGQKIMDLEIPGVSIPSSKWRFYPGGSMASQTLGFVGYKGDELGGRYGLERFYDAELSRDKNSPKINFFAEVFSNIKKNLFSSGVMAGDIITTIEPTVESVLERELNAIKVKYNADGIGGIIMNPKTGAIYAISAKPDFDPNNFAKAGNNNLYANPLVERVLEFGSIVKPLVMAAGIDAGVVNANTSYNDTGSVIVEKKEIFNFDKKGRGPGTTMQTVLSDSLNTGMVLVYQKLGRERMRDYMFSYGIKEKTGIDLPNETSGLVSNLNSPRDIEYANAAFGQGIALTPVEMIRALASLGNGGVLVTPHLVEKIKYTDGRVKEITYPTTPSKISPETATEITRMLVNVMDKSLKGGLAKFEHYSVAVKTGTAQVANASDGGYYKDRHTHSFFGYFPAYDPEFVILLYAINPKGVLYASQTWADPFISLTKFLINYYEVPPDR